MDRGHLDEDNDICKCLAKVVDTMETGVLSIPISIRITPCPLRLLTSDFVDRGHLDGEIDI